jgi:putative transposase
MVREYKTEMKSSPQQAQKILQAIGVCRFLYNRYLAFNIELSKQGKKFMSGYDFDKYVNHAL